jgi:integrase
MAPRTCGVEVCRDGTGAGTFGIASRRWHAGNRIPPRPRHARICKLLKMPADFVLHLLRDTFGIRLVEAGADAFTIMKIMGHSSATISQQYVHPSAETVERPSNVRCHEHAEDPYKDPHNPK